MRMRNGLVLTAAAAALAGTALTSQAGVIVGMNEVTDLGNPSNQSGTLTAPGYQAYLLTLQTTDPGEVITAVDFTPPTGMPDPGSRGIYGALFQRAAIDPDTGDKALTPFALQQNNSTSPNSLDSHFIVPSGNRATVTEPVEDNGFVNPPGSPPDSATSDFGTGSFLNATFGLRGDVPGAQTARLDLAYIVLADGDIATFNGLIATSAGTFPVSGTIPIPEPTAGLALLAGAGLMGLRRRRA